MNPLPPVVIYFVIDIHIHVDYQVPLTSYQAQEDSQKDVLVEDKVVRKMRFEVMYQSSEVVPRPYQRQHWNMRN